MFLFLASFFEAKKKIKYNRYSYQYLSTLQLNSLNIPKLPFFRKPAGLHLFLSSLFYFSFRPYQRANSIERRKKAAAYQLKPSPVKTIQFPKKVMPKKSL